MLGVENVMQFTDMRKANYKYMTDYNKTKVSSYLKKWDLNNLHGWVILQKLRVDGFNMVENKSKLD